MNLRSLAYAATLGALSYLQPFRPFVVEGNSMSPTLASGQWLVGKSRPKQISRGDVIVFRHGSETMIKRVAFLPGDRIERYRFIGEWKLPYNSVMREAMVRRGLPRWDLIVPPESLYVVGDNIAESVDSRTYGAIPMSDVLAIVPGVGPSVDPWRAPAHETHALVAQI